MKQIPFNQIKNIRTGHAQDAEKATGCTVMICDNGAVAGVDVRGGGPASRETELLNPLANADKIYSVFFSGGSAFGLDATGGVMKYLSEHKIGYDTGLAVIPLVCASSIFDLVVGSPDAFPSQQMAYEACLDSEKNTLREGNVGAGQGATVGKYNKSPNMMKSGLGTFAVELGELQIGALTVVNAIGDVYENGQIIAGLLNNEQTDFADTEKLMIDDCHKIRDYFTGNTTLAVIVTNAAFTKPQMNKIASMAQNGMARAISPVHTTADGDSVYALSVGDIHADINAVGTIAAKVLQQAIINALKAAQPIYNLKTVNCLNSK